MQSLIKKMSLGALALWSLGAHAQNAQWTLSTEDTRIEISVSNNKIYIDSFKNASGDWDWVSAPCEVPLPCLKTGTSGQTPNWTYAGVAEKKTDGHSLILRFSSTTPLLSVIAFPPA